MAMGIYVSKLQYACMPDCMHRTDYSKWGLDSPKRIIIFALSNNQRMINSLALGKGCKHLMGNGKTSVKYMVQI